MPNLLLVSLERAGSFVNPLRTLASGDTDALQRFQAGTGWIFATDVTAMLTAVNALIDTADETVVVAQALAEKEKPPLADLIKALGDFVSALEGAETAIGGLCGLATEPDLQRQLVKDLRDLLILNDLQRRSSVFFAVLAALGLVESVLCPPLSTKKGVLVRRARFRPILHFDRLQSLFEDPGAYLQNLYLPKGRNFDDEAARRFIHKLATQLSPLATLAGARLESHSSDLPASLLPDLGVLVGRTDLTADERAAFQRHFRSADLMWEVSPAQFGLRAEALPTGVAGASGLVGPGLEFALVGSFDMTVAEEGWSVEAQATAEVDVLGVSNKEVKFGTGVPHFSPRVDLNLTGPFVIGADSGPRLELTAFRAWAFAELGTQIDAGFGLALDGLALAIGGGESDGFLGKVVPSLRVELDASLEWSIQRGLLLSAEAGLNARIPLNLKIPPVLEVPYLDLSIHVDGSGLVGEARSLVLGSLGPLHLTVDGLGVGVTVDFDVEKPKAQFALLAPQGFGFSMEVPKVITGGGFLKIIELEDGSHQYSGAAGFEILEGALSLNAFGLVVAGPGRFSMLVSVTASFTPIQLGYGFTLNGVGGLLGINRTLDPVALGDGARNGQLDAVLFPKNAMAEAARILENLDAYFPEQPDSYVLGAMVILGYQTFIQAKLGIVISFPYPLRIALLGQLWAALPAKSGVVQINLDVVGILDLTAKKISVDAGLHDSTIAGFALSGQMAMRLAYGDTPAFLLAVGGFHPAFVPPDGFPTLNRLALAMDLSDALQITCQTYFAITSNTLQFGAAASLVFSVSEVEITGSAHFDALITFRPFHFTADLGVAVGIQVFGMDLLSGSLEVCFSGPAPRWNLAGEAVYSVAGVENRVPVNLSFGPTYATEERTVLDVTALISEAISAPSAWVAGAGTLKLRSLTATETGTWIATDATLELRQSVAPLGLTLERYGVGVPGLPGPYTLDVKLASGEALASLGTVNGAFAVGQFLDLTLSEQLRAPSFEDYPAGITVGSALVLPPVNSAASCASTETFEVLALGGVTVPAALQTAGAASAPATPAAPTAAPMLSPTRYGLSGTASVVATDSTPRSYAESRARKGKNRILPTHLLKAS